MQKEFKVEKSSLILNYSCFIIFSLILILIIITAHVILKIIFGLMFLLLFYDYLTMPYKVIITQDNKLMFKSILLSKTIKPDQIVKIFKKRKRNRTIYIKCEKRYLKMFSPINRFNELLEFIVSLNPQLQGYNL